MFSISFQVLCTAILFNGPFCSASAIRESEDQFVNEDRDLGRYRVELCLLMFICFIMMYPNLTDIYFIFLQAELNALIRMRNSVLIM